MLGFLIKKGNKNKAKKIMDEIFLTLSKKIRKPLCLILFKIFAKLNVFVESKIIRNKRSKYTVPFSITLRRRSYLIIKWLMQAAEENKKKIPISEKISLEILSLLENSSSRALKFKLLNNKQALLNRSNIHYRW